MLSALRNRGIMAWPQVGLDEVARGAANAGGLYQGRCIQILVMEVGELTAAQTAWLDTAARNGAFVALVKTEADLLVVEERFRDLGPRARTVWEGRSAPRLPSGE